MARTNAKAAPSPWDCVTLSEEDRATAICNVHRKIGKDRACGSGDGPILADRQTDRQTRTHTHTHTNTQTYSAQYFRTPYGGDAK